MNLGSVDWEKRIVAAIKNRETTSRNINEDHDERRTSGQKIADAVANTMGSWRFIIIQSVILAIWIVLNTLAWIAHWDPYPFILLNLALSFQAAYAAPIIMMSQNRQEAKDRLRAENDYNVNIKAEIEVAELHHKLDSLRTAQLDKISRDMTIVLEQQQRQITLLERHIALLENRSKDAN